MRPIIYFIIVFLWCTSSLRGAEEVLSYGRFGNVHLYAPSEHPAHLVLFISGDGGWNLGVVDMARALASLDARVVGIDIIHYLTELEKAPDKCAYPASDFELLSKYIQQKYNYPEYQTPILVGYSSGATLAYILIVQAPLNTFKAAISLGFCPDLEFNKPFCKGDGLEWDKLPAKKGYLFKPKNNLQTPWIVLQGKIDQVCSPAETEKYLRDVKTAQLIHLPKVGHGFSVQKNWMPQFQESFKKITVRNDDTEIAGPDAPVDLPLIEVPASYGTQEYFAVLLSGDGGWATPDKGIAQKLSEAGIPVAGLNSLHYFWKKRTPDQAALDLQKIIDYYMNRWHKQKVILIGYSMGADVLPFIINRLSPETRTRIDLVTFIGLSHRADFEFHFSNWLNMFSSSTEKPVMPELQRLKGMNLLCMYGADDDDVLCKDQAVDFVKVVVLSGGHRIGDNYEPIVHNILAELHKIQTEK